MPLIDNTEHSTRDLRFQFGANWAAFLDSVTEERVEEATESLRRMLEAETLRGKRFLDIGCGSGLFSLAARRLGAIVRSFDYDPESVVCATELNRRFPGNADDWTIEQGSVLDRSYLDTLGTFDVVYSWGVLHHTGDMMTALENALVPLAENGYLYVAIYNDQGMMSVIWRKVKRMYCSSALGKGVVLSAFLPLLFLRSVAAGLIKYGNPLGQFTRYKKQRGMSIYHDWIDWLGGYPFEVAKPEIIIRFYMERGLTLTKLTTTQRLGCNEFVFQRTTSGG